MTDKPKTIQEALAQVRKKSQNLSEQRANVVGPEFNPLDPNPVRTLRSKNRMGDSSAYIRPSGRLTPSTPYEQERDKFVLQRRIPTANTQRRSRGIGTETTPTANTQQPASTVASAANSADGAAMRAAAIGRERDNADAEEGRNMRAAAIGRERDNADAEEGRNMRAAAIGRERDNADKADGAEIGGRTSVNPEVKKPEPFEFKSKGGKVSADELNRWRVSVGNKQATLGQYMNARDKLTARTGGANDPNVIQKKLDREYEKGSSEDTGRLQSYTPPSTTTNASTPPMPPPRPRQSEPPRSLPTNNNSNSREPERTLPTNASTPPMPPPRPRQNSDTEDINNNNSGDDASVNRNITFAKKTKAQSTVFASYEHPKSPMIEAFLKLHKKETHNLFSEAKHGSHPKTTKEKELASLGHPKDKITHKDVLIGRGVLAKEESEVPPRTAKERIQNKLGTGPKSSVDPSYKHQGASKKDRAEMDNLVKKVQNEDVEFSEEELAHIASILEAPVAPTPADYSGSSNGVSKRDLSDETIVETKKKDPSELKKRGRKAGVKVGAYRKAGEDESDMSTDTGRGHPLQQIRDAHSKGNMTASGGYMVSHKGQTKEIPGKEARSYYSDYHNAANPRKKEEVHNSFLNKHFGSGTETTRAVKTDDQIVQGSTSKSKTDSKGQAISLGGGFNRKGGSDSAYMRYVKNKG